MPDDLALEWGRHLAELPEHRRGEARRTARQALVAALPAEEVGRPPVRTLGEFVDEELELPPILVEPGLVARGGVTALVSKGGKGKTTLSFNRLLRWAMGRPLFDELPDVMRPTQPLRSLIIENEGGGWHTQKILRLMLEKNGFPEEDVKLARENVHVWGDGGWSAMKLDNDDNVELVKRAVETTKTDILFLEPFRGLWRGEENSSTEMAVVMDAFHEIANTYDCAVLVTHHESKGAIEQGADAMEKSRGSGAFSDLGAVMERWAPVQGAQQREWSLTKARYDEPPAPVRMQFDRERWGYRYVGENENVRKAVRVISRAGPGAELSVVEIEDELEETTQATVRRWLETAVEQGTLKERMVSEGPTRKRRYRLADTPDEDDAGGGLAIT